MRTAASPAAASPATPATPATPPRAGTEFIVRSAIVRSDKPTRGLEAVPAANANQANRIVGYLPDGTHVVVAHRPGKGGMDFNKLMGGKVFAVAADGFSPVYEKDAAGKTTRVQKREDGLPLYSASGFYLLSSKEYPALDIFEARTRLLDEGERVALVTEAQLAERQCVQLADQMDLDLLELELVAALGDEHNLVRGFDADANRRRERGVRRAREEAEDAGDAYTGVAFKQAAVSPKDGNPFVEFVFRAGGKVVNARVLREAEVLDEDSGRLRPVYFDAVQAVAHLKQGPEWATLEQALAAGETVQFHYVRGHVMRTSVSFRRKCANVLEAHRAEPTKTVYGDAVYILAALEHWTRGIVTLMHSMHPNFPAADYDVHHYVCAVRQAEVSMTKSAEGRWSAPRAIALGVASELLRTARAPVAVAA
jgi:hypothetical protein